MNRFEYLEARLHEVESFVSRDRNVKLYDGDEKTHFEDGEVVLTTHRLFWGRPGEIARAAVTLCLNLNYVLSLSEESASSNFFGRKIRLILHLRPPVPEKLPGPLVNSSATHIKLSGRNGLNSEFSMALKETLQARMWEVQSLTAVLAAEQGLGTLQPRTVGPGTIPRKMRTGIVGIERSIEEKAKQTDDNIALAFQDLRVLMGMAEEMVTISKVISNKIRDSRGEISDDETVRFKSYLMSLGIDDPVTRGNSSSNEEFYRNLGRQLSEMLLDHIEETGGMMSLVDVYCRVNRARGLELISPEDLLGACRQLNGPLKLRTFPSGAMVLQLESQDDVLVAADTRQRVEESTSLAVEELANIMGISLLLAKERLLAAERQGAVCRDESVEGLRFYPNKLLTG